MVLVQFELDFGWLRIVRLENVRLEKRSTLLDYDAGDGQQLETKQTMTNSHWQYFGW